MLAQPSVGWQIKSQSPETGMQGSGYIPQQEKPAGKTLDWRVRKFGLDPQLYCFPGASP